MSTIDANSKMSVWEAACKTDPAYTKNFNKSGYKGTAVNPIYLIKKATEMWGPMGAAWGLRVTEHGIIDGAPILAENGTLICFEKIHFVKALLFYPCKLAADGEGKLPCFGQTVQVGRDSRGIRSDEDAHKKSFTDALTKGLSWLGFAADVHMGMFDDLKYVNGLKMEYQGAQHGAPGSAPNGSSQGHDPAPHQNGRFPGDEILDKALASFASAETPEILQKRFAALVARGLSPQGLKRAEEALTGNKARFALQHAPAPSAPPQGPAQNHMEHQGDEEIPV